MTRNDQRAVMKTRLESYLRLREECERLRRRIEQKREDMTYLRSVVSGGAAQRGGQVVSGVERAVELMDGMLRYYAELAGRREEEERAILEMVESLRDSQEREVLYYRYIEGVRYDDIPERVYLSQRTVWTRFRDGVDHLCDRYLPPPDSISE